MPMLRPCAIVRGANDVASATALRLVEAGYAVLLAEGPTPAVTRRGQSFADAAFDGVATLEGVTFRRVGDAAAWLRNGAHDLAYCSQPLDILLAALMPELLVDARMKKRATPENQRGLAPLVIGLGPNFTAGGNCDLAVETGWGDDLGRVVEVGPCRTLAGEPKPIGGWGRERYVYAPAAGVFRTDLNIGDAVREGQIVANIVAPGGDTPIAAPKTGLLRGLIHDGVTISEKTKCVEVVPVGTKVTGLAERPARIAAGVMEAILRRADPPPLARAAIAGVLRNAQTGDLPLFAATLGLDRRELGALVATCLPGVTPELEWEAGAHALCASQAPSPFAPLAQLLFEHRASGLAERPARWLAHAVAAAGFGSRHLWQDLGLSGRPEVSRLMRLCFPTLAAGNTTDLKWKRFLFQALGERLGTPGLRPPGCAGCDTYANCFGSKFSMPGPASRGGHISPPQPSQENDHAHQRP